MIRDATVDDIPRLVAMGERFLTETVYSGRVTGNRAAITRTLAMLIQGEMGAIFVAERDGALVGMIGLLLFEHPFTGDATVSELFWWVEPEHRGHGVRLLRRGEQWALDAGARRMQMTAPTAAVGQLYERLGYEFLEAAYQRAIA